MAKPKTVTITVQHSPDSTPRKPLVVINDAPFEAAALVRAIQTAAAARPGVSYSEPVESVTPDDAAAPAAAPAVSANDTAGLKTPA